MIGFRETTLDQLAVDHLLEVNTQTGTARLSVPVRTMNQRQPVGAPIAHLVAFWILRQLATPRDLQTFRALIQPLSASDTLIPCAVDSLRTCVTPHFFFQL